MGASIYSVNAIYQGKIEAGRLAFGEMFDPNDLAFFAVSNITFNVLFVSMPNSLWKKYLCLINIVIGVLFIMMTGSRGGGIALSLVVLILLFDRSRNVKYSYKIIIAILTIVAVIYAGSAIDYSRFETITQIGEDYNVWDETGRLQIWNTGIGLMLSNPLTGVGLTCFQEAIGTERRAKGLLEIWQAPHNSIVQIGTETGIFGIILFVLISYKTFSIFGIVKKNSEFRMLAMIAFVSQVGFVGHFVSAMFLSQAYSVYWVFYVVISASIAELNKRKTDSLKYIS